eukprot:1037668-Lingulodinium_polyedra.AAC.2
MARSACEPPHRYPSDVRKALRSWSLPPWWIAKVLAAMQCVSAGLRGVHVFAGQRAIDKAFDLYVGPMASFDILINENHDIL